MRASVVKSIRFVGRVAVAVVAGSTAYGCHAYAQASKHATSSSVNPTSDITSAVGNTPLVELKTLSTATGCRILAKCEHLNPGGSVKDRPALRILLDAEAQGALVPRERREAGDPVPTIVEGTGGNTGVALALLGAARGYHVVLTMPEIIAHEKINAMRTLGAEVVLCPAVAFSDERHYYHTAGRIAAERKGLWTNQFENTSNMAAHRDTTGPEIAAQAGTRVDAFVAAAGTGGTIAGVSTYLRSLNPETRIFLIDPPGSSLAGYVESGCMGPAPGSTITEGIGIGRLTANFAHAKPDAAFRGTDAEAVAMAHYLLRREGVWVGPSAALNVVGAVKAARALGPGHTVVTILCDGGDRNGKIYNEAFLESKDLLNVVRGIDFSRDNADFVH